MFFILHAKIETVEFSTASIHFTNSNIHFPVQQQIFLTNQQMNREISYLLEKDIVDILLHPKLLYPKKFLQYLQEVKLEASPSYLHFETKYSDVIFLYAQTLLVKNKLYK